MKTIWKFPLKWQDEQEIEAPQGALLLSFQIQHQFPCAWMVCPHDSETACETIRVSMYGTGQPVEEDHLKHFMGTVQQGGFVWHFFSERKVKE